MPSPAVTRLLRTETAWTPRRLPTLVAWYKADRLPLADGAAVASVADLSPYGNTLAQGTAGNRPTFVAAGRNGRGVIRSDGDDSLTAADSASLDVTGSYALFVAAKTPASFAASPALLFKGTSGGALGALALYVNTLGRLASYVRGNAVDRTIAAGTMTPLAVSTAYVLGLTWAPETHRFYVNAALVDTVVNADGNTTLDTDGAGLVVGSATTPSANNWASDIFEIVIVGSASPAVLSEADRARMFAYLNREWRVY